MCLHLVYLSHAPARHIRRGDDTEAGYLYGHSLLSFRADHAADDAFERAGGDDHLVATLEAAFLVGDKEDVGVVDLGEADEVVHLAVGNGERRVLAVRSRGEVVVIVAQAGVVRGVDYRVKSHERGSDKEDVGNQRTGDFLVLAVDNANLVMHR